MTVRVILQVSFRVKVKAHPLVRPGILVEPSSTDTQFDGKLSPDNPLASLYNCPLNSIIIYICFMITCF